MRFSRPLLLIFGSILVLSSVVMAISRQADASLLWVVLSSPSDTPATREFYLYHPQTQTKRSLFESENVFRLRWEPNGEWLWYASVDEKTNQERLNRIHWTGCCRTSVIVDNVNEAFSYLDFSPDGKWMIFLKIDLYERLIHLHQVRPNGSQHHRVPIEISPILNPAFVYDWSLDGQHLFFMTYRGDTGDFTTFTGEAGIMVYDLDLENGHLDLVDAIVPRERGAAPRLISIKTTPDPRLIMTLLRDDNGTQLRFLRRDDQNWGLMYSLDVSGYVDHWWNADRGLTVLSFEANDDSSAVMRSEFDSDGLLISRERIANSIRSVVDIEWIPDQRVLDIFIISDSLQTNFDYTILSINILNGEQIQYDIAEICDNSFSNFPRSSLDNEFRFLPLELDGKCHFVAFRVGTSIVDTILIAEDSNASHYSGDNTVDPSWIVVHEHEYNSFRPSQSFMLNIQTRKEIELPNDVLNLWTAIDLDAYPSDLVTATIIGVGLLLITGTAILYTLQQRA